MDPMPLPFRSPGHAALRRGRCSESQRIYLLTFVAAQRHPWFDKPGPAQAAVSALLDSRSWQKSELLAWVLMPDHWHGLVTLGAKDSLPALARSLKSASSRRTRAAMVGEVPWAIWARTYHDRALRQEASVVAAARYVVANPVRAGLVRRVKDYPYWGAVWVER